MNATARPWHIRWTGVGCSIVSDGGHGAIANIHLRKTKTNNTAERAANAALIVRAVNEREDMILALLAVQSAYSRTDTGKDVAMAYAIEAVNNILKIAKEE